MVALLKLDNIKYLSLFKQFETASEIDVERAKLARQRAQSHLEDQDNSDINRAKRALAREKTAYA